MGWPFEKAGPLRLILVLFFLVEGGRVHHVRYRAPTAVFWTVGVEVSKRGHRHCPGEHHYFRPSRDFFLDDGSFLSGSIICVLGGCALIAMGLHGRKERAGASAPISLRGA